MVEVLFHCSFWWALESFIANLPLNFTCYLLLACYPGERNQPNASLVPVGLAWRTSSSCSQVSCYSCDVGAIRMGVFHCRRRLQSPTCFFVASTPKRIGVSKCKQRLAQQIGYFAVCGNMAKPWSLQLSSTWLVTFIDNKRCVCHILFILFSLT